jgi:hypothetical protein
MRIVISGPLYWLLVVIIVLVLVNRVLDGVLAWMRYLTRKRANESAKAD